jgi:inosose dehydratase
MSASTLSSPVQLRHCEVGANPIIWSNDDFSELGGDIPLERCLSEMSAAGYAGAELGHKFPRTAAELASVLSVHGLRLVSGWHSTHLASRPLAEEEQAFGRHLELLAALRANLVIVAECTRAVHGVRDQPLGFDGERPCLSEEEWVRVGEGLTRFAALARAAGLRLVYHHHMGTVIQSSDALDRLLENVPALDLLFDPGHLAFAGIDPIEVLRKHGARVAHVHLKNVRPAIVAQARREKWSFCRAVSEGVFTIPGVGEPGDGSVDFPQVFARLAALDYRGWLVVEAEEDPAKAEPFAKARAARAYVRSHAGI